MKGTSLLLIVNTSIMLESGAPPDKFGVLYHGFNGRINILGLSHFVPGINSFFRDGIGPFNIELNCVDCEIHRFMIKINKTKFGFKL